MSYVYAIRYGPYVKVGVARDPARRLRGIRRDIRAGTIRTPHDLDASLEQPLLAVMGDRETEQLLHLLLHDRHVVGEFFTVDDRYANLLADTQPDHVTATLFRVRRRPPSPRDYIAGIDF